MVFDRSSITRERANRLDVANRMGFLVIGDIFDSWKNAKTSDFYLILPDWHERDLRTFIRRDRNHLSIVIWSIGNEEAEQTAGDE